MFQSLFYWILFSYVNIFLDLFLLLKVSILILLDSILLYFLFDYFMDKEIRFNPYSIGFYSLINCTWTFHIHIGKFQSLFYWILFSYRDNNIWNSGRTIMFQSLFYWILFSYEQIYLVYQKTENVSILILLDSILLSVLQSRLFIFNSYRVFLRI